MRRATGNARTLPGCMYFISSGCQETCGIFVPGPLQEQYEYSELESF
jgi:hypothetical protein